MITEFSFGRIVVNGTVYTDDLKILQDRVIPQWWRKRGHRVDVEDLEDIIAFRPDILVLGKGEPGRMVASSSTRRLLEQNGIVLIEEKTSRAVRSFNRLLQEGQRRVAAGIHVSC